MLDPSFRYSFRIRETKIDLLETGALLLALAGGIIACDRSRFGADRGARP